mmetsp:Transcript_7979/g.25472  ORF Transcript_7979/g.25472 Transcript_7979/m.25472 type:complete len:243 (-) Transcript_7979:132-860(-)
MSEIESGAASRDTRGATWTATALSAYLHVGRRRPRSPASRRLVARQPRDARRTSKGGVVQGSPLPRELEDHAPVGGRARLLKERAPLRDAPRARFVALCRSTGARHGGSEQRAREERSHRRSGVPPARTRRRLVEAEPRRRRSRPCSSRRRRLRGRQKAVEEGEESHGGERGLGPRLPLPRLAPLPAPLWRALPACPLRRSAALRCPQGVLRGRPGGEGGGGGGERAAAGRCSPEGATAKPL